METPCALAFGVIFIQLLVPGALSDDVDIRLELLPDDPQVIIGNPLLMTCTVKSKRVNSTDLRFEIKFYDNPPGQKATKHIAHRFISVLNVTTVALNYTQVRPWFDRATVFCFTRQRYDRFDAQIIKVGYQPSRPMIYDYRVFNWQSFTFKWNVSRVDNVYNSQYTAWYKSKHSKNFLSCLDCFGPKKDCPNQTGISGSDSCTVRDALSLVHPSGIMHFKVTATSEIGHVESKTFTLDLYDFIEPRRVQNLSVWANGADIPQVTFNAPKSGHRIKYYITVDCGSEQTWVRNETAYRISQKLTNLPCFTQCRVSVRCKPFYYEDTKGYLSEWENATFTSQEEVPTKAPEMCTSCFESIQKNDVEREIVLYFKHLELKAACGSLIEYRAVKLLPLDDKLNGTYDSEGDCSSAVMTTTSGNMSSIRLSLPLNQDYRLAVEAVTNAGYRQSTNCSSIYIPAHTDIIHPPKNLTVLVETDSLVRVSWLKHSEAIQYVVVWCLRLKDVMRCSGELNWKSVNHTTYRISIDDDHDNFLFGIALETSSGSSGIYWSNCTYNINARLPSEKR